MQRIFVGSMYRTDNSTEFPEPTLCPLSLKFITYHDKKKLAKNISVVRLYSMILKTQQTTLKRSQFCPTFIGSYLWTYDLYGAVCNAFDEVKSITRASVRGLGPGNRDFFGPCEKASSVIVSGCCSIYASWGTRSCASRPPGPWQTSSGTASRCSLFFTVLWVCITLMRIRRRILLVTLMQIRMRTLSFTLMRIRILFLAYK